VTSRKAKLVRHLAKFCAKSLSHGKEDLARAWVQHAGLEDDNAVPSQESDREAEDTIDIVDGHDNAVEDSKLAVASPQGWFRGLVKVWNASSLSERLHMLTK
jgi:hypothetical protein